MFLGLVDILTKRAVQGIAENEHALELDRNLATAHATIGLGKIFIGRAEDTDAHIAEALRLSPLETTAYAWMTLTREWRGATSATSSRRSHGFSGRSRPTEIIRIHILSWGLLLRSLVDLTRGGSAVRVGLALNPAFTISRLRATWTAMTDEPTHLAEIDRVLEGMREAGAPEK